MAGAAFGDVGVAGAVNVVIFNTKCVSEALQVTQNVSDE